MPAWQAMYDKKPGGGTHRPDLSNAEFALYQGVYPGHSGMGYQGLARKSVKFVKENGLKLTVIDPVMQGGTDIPGGTKWMPIKPATDGAFVLGMMRWMFENEKFNYDFLECTTREAAEEIGLKSHTNATMLVIQDENHENYRRFLRAEDIGLDREFEEGEETFIVIEKGTNNPVVCSDVKRGELFYEGEVEGIKVKSVLSILRDNVNEFTIEEYAEKCGLTVDEIIEVANDFSSHGHKIGVDSVGATVTLNGFPFATSLFMLPAMFGAWNMKGGMASLGTSYSTHSDGPRYNLKTIEGAPEVKGARISREAFPYEKTSEYKNKLAKGINPYPSKLPWHPNGFSMDGHAIFSAVNKYPYQAKIMVCCAANPIYGGPSLYNDMVINELKKTSVVPLIIGIDVVVGETTAFADYLIPDTNYNEHWAAIGSRGNHMSKITGVRWPVVEPPTPKVGEFDQHISMEAYIIEVAKRIGLKGYGDNAITDVDGNTWDLNTREDYWLKMVANIAYDDGEVEVLDKEDFEITGLDQVDKEWEEAVTKEELPLVKSVIAKGGRFGDEEDIHDGDFMKKVSTARIALYSEETASSRNSITGEYFEGAPRWLDEKFANGKLLEEVYPEEEWPFRLCSSKPKLRGLSMLGNSKTLQNIQASNQIEINSLDAEELGLKDGQRVEIDSGQGKTEGILKVREGISRGTLGVHFGFGKWEYGSKDMEVDGEVIKGDSIRGEGTATNQLGIMDDTVDGIFGISEANSGSPIRNGLRLKIRAID